VKRRSYKFFYNQIGIGLLLLLSTVVVVVVLFLNAWHLHGGDYWNSDS
jgi:hypothetical protein